MLKRSTINMGKSSQYQNRFMQYPYRRTKPRHLQPSGAYKKSPLAHKQPEEYENTWDTRTGVEWHDRIRNRGIYKHWPWVKWTDDHLRKHVEVDSHARTFSAKAQVRGGQFPLWNHYNEVGEHYGLPDDAPAHFMGDVMHKYIGKTWSKSEVQAFFGKLAEGGFTTISQIQQQSDKLSTWNGRVHRVPAGFVEHVLMLAADICHQNALQCNRNKLHAKGILRTREMERYFALPYASGPAMPTTLAKYPGKYPAGRYLHMIDSPFHPLQVPDATFKRNFYPA